MSYLAPTYRFIKAGVDLTGSSVVVATTKSNQRFIPMSWTVVCTAVTNFSTAASISIGTNSISYDNLLTTTALTNLDTANELISGTFTNPRSSVAASTDIYFALPTPASVTVGGSMTATVIIEGYYL